MKLYLENNKWIDTQSPIDISHPISNTSQNNNAWYCPSPEIEPVRTKEFLGSVKEGGNVNFRNVFFNPHGNGTHTECVGHIAENVYSINERLNNYFFTAELITVTPQKLNPIRPEDFVITQEMLEGKLGVNTAEAIVIRTLPNVNKVGIDYSNTNPPYLTKEAIEWIVEKNFQHLLIDLPSVDPEFDDGALQAHHIFWDYPNNEMSTKTITELIYVKDEVKDGSYILNLMVAPFENDASPSKPILYEINN